MPETFYQFLIRHHLLVWLTNGPHTFDAGERGGFTRTCQYNHLPPVMAMTKPYFVVQNSILLTSLSGSCDSLRTLRFTSLTFFYHLVVNPIADSGYIGNRDCWMSSVRMHRFKVIKMIEEDVTLFWEDTDAPGRAVIVTVRMYSSAASAFFCLRLRIIQPSSDTSCGLRGSDPEDKHITQPSPT